MKLLSLSLVFLAVGVHYSNAQISDADQLHVANILSEVTQLLRHKHNISRPIPALDPANDDHMRAALLENDLRLTVPQAARMLNSLKTEMGMDSETDESVQIARRVDPHFTKWTFPIAYNFDGTHSDTEKAEIRRGIDRWQKATCVTFREFPSESAIGSQPHIVITKGSGCWSYVGRTGNAGQQLSLGDGCVDAGITSHEFGHALGLYHEHMRPDRDNYITINWGNMISGYEGAFAKVAAQDDVDYGTGYDVTSVMHYNSLGFSIDYWGKKRVIVPFNQHQLTSIGNREYLTFSDAKRINMHYGCIAKMCSGINLAQPCQNGGYQDPSNCAKCRCPNGFGGDFCQGPAPSVGATSCGGVINVPACSSVALTSPGYPRGYSAGSSCAWKVQSSGGLVFAFEKQPAMPASSADTCIDYVEIVTDTSRLGSPGDRFCQGGKSSGRVVAANGQAMVVFGSTTSARGGGGSGFKLIAYATCSGTSASSLTTECLMTSTGYDYQGSLAKSDSGSCSPWSGQSSQPDLSFPDSSLMQAGSKCRNPDSRTQPWCYVGGYSKVGYCSSIPQCPTGSSPPPASSTTSTSAPMTTTRGASSTSTTKSTTQSQSTTQRSKTTTKSQTTLKPSTDCRRSQDGHEYMGKVSKTKSGIACQRWDGQWPQTHSYTSPYMFPDNSVATAANYCRNPDPSTYPSGVWCLTTNPFVRWEYCDVPMCSANDVVEQENVDTDQQQENRRMDNYLDDEYDGLIKLLLHYG